MAVLWLLPVLHGALAQRHFPEELHFVHPDPKAWELLSEEVDRDANLIDIIIAVAHGKTALLESELLEVSDPRSSKYGRYWKLEDIAAAVDAGGKARRLKDWLRDEGKALGIEETVAGDFLRCQLPVSHAQRLFQVSLKPYRHQPSGKLRFGMAHAHRYSVPAALAEDVDFVSGLQLPRGKLPRPSPHEHARRHGSRSLLQEPGDADILVVEARDRAFQVHVSVFLPDDFVARICGASLVPNCTLPDLNGGGGPVQGFNAVLTPMRLAGKEDFLPPVNLSGNIVSGGCASSDSDLPAGTKQLTCVVVLGPSLGLVNFSPTQLRMQAAFVDGSTGAWTEYGMMAYPALGMTVADLRKLYNVPSGYRNNVMNNSQAIGSFFNISASEADAQHFHAAMGTRRQPKVTFVGQRGEPGVEGNIDLQWIQGMGNNVPTTYWATPGGDQSTAHEPFLEWLVDLANSSQPPLVNSLSYGENEEDYSIAYVNRGNVELAKLGLRGVTVLAATGDTGIQGAAQEGGTPPRCAPFAPVWPASSPYITAVGATMVSNHVSNVCNVDRVYALGTNSSMPFSCPEISVGEIVCSLEKGSMITGGGGFSNVFPRPSYQDEAVKEYFMSANLNKSLFNASGRAYPDISAIGQNIPIFFQGQLVMVGGTSSSSPIVAGLVALLNGQRLEAGHPPLGFLNPLLYSTYARQPQIVNDILTGDNRASNQLLPPGQVKNCPHGLPAIPGWDASSGLGSPNFVEMMKHLVKEPFRQRSGGESKVLEFDFI